MQKNNENIIVGGGIAGLICALKLLQAGQQVLIIDADSHEKLGGQAKIAFGGMALVDTPEQRRLGIKDSPELAYQDWCRFAEFSESDEMPRLWAKHYVENVRRDVYEFVKSLGVKFLPAVNWVERGEIVKGNSLPRYHILWGCSRYLVSRVIEEIKSFPSRQITFKFNFKVKEPIWKNGSVVGVLAQQKNDHIVEFYAENTIIACGGFSGDLTRVKKNWPTGWGDTPENILNGSLQHNDGILIDAFAKQNVAVTHLDKMWNYAAGVLNPKQTFTNQGLSLIPCKSALWLDAKGNRFTPPLVTGFDTRDLCQRIAQSNSPHTWQVLNQRIALKELAVSGCDFNRSIRDRNLYGLVKEALFGNRNLVERLLKENPNFVTAENLSSLTEKMNQIAGSSTVEHFNVQKAINDYDRVVQRPQKFWNDPQLRKIEQLRKWRSEKIRTCKPKPILDGSPLIAIKLNLISRKCLGGIKTDLNSRVLDDQNKAINGLLAIGEASGFGGGGANGIRSLEGTFISGAILNATQAARYLSQKS